MNKRSRWRVGDRVVVCMQDFPRIEHGTVVEVRPADAAFRYLVRTARGDVIPYFESEVAPPGGLRGTAATPSENAE